jgi:signal transduction histidine kinase
MLLSANQFASDMLEELSADSKNRSQFHCWGRYTLGVVGLAAAYAIAGKIGLSLAFLNASASAVWPPAGIGLAAVLLGGYRLWPGIFLGAFLVNISTQGTWWTTLSIATGNTLEAVLGAWLTQRFASGAQAFETVPRILRFVVATSALSPIVSATVGVTTLSLAGFANWAQYRSIWLTWWLGDAVSDLTIAPLLVMWCQNPRLQFTRALLMRGLALGIFLLVIGDVVFLTRFEAFGGMKNPLGYLALVPLLWAAFDFGQRGAATATVGMCAIAVWGTMHRVGPFVTPQMNLSLLLLQSFVGTSSVTVLILAAVVAQGRRAEEALRVENAQRQEAQARLAAANQELELRVQERTASLRSALEQMEEFSYTISHDLRAPLRAMHGYSQALLEDHSKALPPEAVGYIERIANNALRLDKMILDVLTFSRITRAELPIERVSLNRLVPDLIQHYPAMQAPHAQVEVAPLLDVLAHEPSLVQVLSNLIGNAVKFVPPGVGPYVRIWTERSDDKVRLWIEDNGIGVPPAVQHRLFKMFERLHPGLNYEGNGVGLGIVKKAVERMGGRVGFESGIKVGSRFWIELSTPADAAPANDAS